MYEYSLKIQTNFSQFCVKCPVVNEVSSLGYIPCCNMTNAMLLWEYLISFLVMFKDWTTTTESQMGQFLLKKEYEPREAPKSMVEADLFQSADFYRRSPIWYHHYTELAWLFQRHLGVKGML